MRFKKESKLDAPIDKILTQMATTEPGSQEYHQLAMQLDQLYSTKAQQRNSGVSTDTIWLVAGNLLGILIIVAYEQKHVMASRGMNFLIKPKAN